MQGDVGGRPHVQRQEHNADKADMQCRATPGGTPAVPSKDRGLFASDNLFAPVTIDSGTKTTIKKVKINKKE